MKKILTMILVVCMLVSLAACNKSDNQTTDGPTTGDSIKIDVFWYTFADTYLASVRNAMEQKIAGIANISATQHDCQDNQARQTEMVQTAITQGTDLLVVNIVTTGSEEAAMNIVSLAKDAGLPIIFFNREVSDAVVNSYDKCVFVGTDADEAGYMQGQAVAQFLLADDNLSRYDLDGDGEIKYIMFRGEHGNAEAFGRTLYSVTEANRLLAAAGVKLVPSRANETSNQYDDDGISNYFLYGNWSAATAADLMRTALTANSLTDGSIELILANNDDQAIGAIEAMNEKGFNTGDDNAVGYIPVFGVDATAVAVEAINAGKMTGTILQDGPAMADCIVALARNIANGADLMAGTSGYNIDSGVAKIRIPYAIVDGSAPVVPPSADGPINVDVFWYTFADTYLASVRNAMVDILSGNPNINATQHDCQDNQGRQTDMVQTAITQGTDLLIVNIVSTGSEEAAMNIVNLAKNAGIPIIFFNREVSDAVVNAYDRCAFVGTDADEAGYMQGQAVAQFLLTGDNLSRYDLNGDGEIRYIMFRGEHGNAEAFGRTLYSVTEANRLLASRGVRLVPSRANETSNQYDDDGISNFFLYGNWSAANAANLMRTALIANSLTDGSIELILANNDDQAIGAIEAMNERGFNTGDSSQVGYIPVFGVDATAVAVEAINAGKMTGTVLQDGPAMAACIVALADNIANGADLMAGTSGYNIDSGVAKIRIPYAIVS